jgi:hypothetical protein
VKSSLVIHRNMFFKKSYFLINCKWPFIVSILALPSGFSFSAWILMQEFFDMILREKEV